MPRSTNDYGHLFADNVPLMDVRAPVEFDHGAFPQSINLPLLDNEQRRLVGTEYKRRGQAAAIALGESLATPEIRRQRIDQWCRFADENPGAHLYCFRGGLRSQITQRWLADNGVDMPLVEGGYKALRRFLIDQIEERTSDAPLVLVSGRTGTGKTRVLERLEHHLDLEGLAHHRGSAFGRRPGGQPGQIDFENRVAIDLFRHHRLGSPRLFIEDESRLVGRCFVPQPLQDAMARAPMVVIEADIDTRVQTALEDYVLHLWPEYCATHEQPDDAREAFAEHILGAVDRIKKRLGGLRHKTLRGQFAEALESFFESGDAEGFRPGIAMLLSDYYDPMYDYQLDKRRGDVLFAGPAEAVIDFCRQLA
ncbi:MAG: tRNA 2-selenouridine(34) synthase MnmH [Pseudomonadota bacterium]